MLIFWNSTQSNSVNSWNLSLEGISHFERKRTLKQGRYIYQEMGKLNKEECCILRGLRQPMHAVLAR